LSGVFGGGMLGLFLLGMLSKRARNLSAILAVILGTCIIFWLAIPDMIRWLERHGATTAADNLSSFAERFGGISPFHVYMVPVFGTLAIVLFGILLSALDWRKKSRVASEE
jgi:SSS family solute:Na+ symporter